MRVRRHRPGRPRAGPPERAARTVGGTVAAAAWAEGRALGAAPDRSLSRRAHVAARGHFWWGGHNGPGRGGANRRAAEAAQLRTGEADVRAEVAALRRAVADLRGEMVELSAGVADLHDQLETLRRDLYG